MNNKVVGFSSVNEDELMNVDGGIIDVLLAVAVWSFNAVLQYGAIKIVRSNSK